MNKYVVVLLVVLASCKKNNDVTSNGGSTTDTSSRTVAQFYEYNILPSTTNSSILLFNNPHEVCLDTRTTLKNKLFIFLPGTTGYPTAYKLIVKQAASQGYHAIGLMYPNDPSIYTASNNDTTNTQFAKCRQEIFDGTDQTSGVSSARRVQGEAHVESLGGSGIGNDPRLYHRAGRCRGNGHEGVARSHQRTRGRPWGQLFGSESTYSRRHSPA